LNGFNGLGAFKGNFFAPNPFNPWLIQSFGIDLKLDQEVPWPFNL